MWTYFLATPDETRRAWMVKEGGVAAEVYLTDDPTPGSFAGKMREAQALRQSGTPVIFPR